MISKYFLIDKEYLDFIKNLNNLIRKNNVIKKWVKDVNRYILKEDI